MNGMAELLLIFCIIVHNSSKISLQALAHSAFTKYNKSIPDASSYCGSYLTYFYILEISPPVKLFTDINSLILFHPLCFTDAVS